MLTPSREVEECKPLVSGDVPIEVVATSASADTAYAALTSLVDMTVQRCRLTPG